MKIAVEGCAHGELEKIYECIETLQEREGIKVDLLICCGDFQAVRNRQDLAAMAVPDKYKKMCTFYKYYSGEKQAPILTIFIGGNHEASNYLQELPYGGWVAPNIYYLGRAGVVNFGDLRIGGLSGIFKGQDYLQGLWESPPYTPNSLRSVYHIRSIDVFRLSQLKEKMHVMLSHDWPKGITEYGNVQNLLQRKPFFREDIESNRLGSPPAEKLLQTLKPDYWFAAHLHCQFVAVVKHELEKETKFLALDKCLPKRRHLQILNVPEEYDGDKKLKHDIEWLAVLKSTNHLMTVKNINCHLPGPGSEERFDFTPLKEEKGAVIELMQDLTIKPESFVRTAPIYVPNAHIGPPNEAISNPQTVSLCDKLGIDDPLHIVLARTGRTMQTACIVETISTQSSTGSDPSFVSKTPIKCSKLSLPAPVTPRENLYKSTEESKLSVNSDFLSESYISEPETPSKDTKKIFKRRNLTMYTPEADDSVDTSSSLLDTESPKSSKLPCRTNLL